MPSESIAILRPNAVGDFIFALPALDAVRKAWPDAWLVYLGKRWHSEFLPGRGIVDETLELPPIRGVTAAEEDSDEVERFCSAMRARRFALAFQLFGGGSSSNVLVRRFGARCSVGLRAPDAPPLDRWHPYIALQNERLRLLETVKLAGARPGELAPRIPVLARDAQELEARLSLPPQPIAVLNPGATDPRRRWPAERFAEVGDALAAHGAAVVLNGSDDERELTAQVAEAMRAPALDAGGVLSLNGLTALLARAHLVVSNDTGPLYLAQALGTPTVGIYWLTNVIVSGPLELRMHRQAVSVEVRCSVCGAENLTSRCPHDPSFVAGISTPSVSSLALELWDSYRAAPSPAVVPR